MSAFEDEVEQMAEAVVACGWWVQSDLERFIEAWNSAIDQELGGGASQLPITILSADASSPPQTSGSDIEKRVVDVLDDLARDRIGKGSVEQIKGAAEQSIRRQTRDGGLHDAITRGGR